MKTWYIRNNDEHLGPYSIEELRLLGVYSDDYVWKEGLQKWTKANLVPELTDLLINVEHAIFPAERKQEKDPLEDCHSLARLNKLNAGFVKLFNVKTFGSLFKKSAGR